ncbi:MAG: AzlD domain-containing protein [Ectothiorhodospiraceae bacterium]
MSDPMVWLVIIAIGAGTFFLRFSGLQLLGGRELPAAVTRILRYVPPAVIAAIVAPAIVFGGPDPGFTLLNPRLLAGLIAAGIAWATRSVLATLGVGMSALWVLGWLL